MDFYLSLATLVYFNYLLISSHPTPKEKTQSNQIRSEYDLLYVSFHLLMVVKTLIRTSLQVKKTKAEKKNRNIYHKMHFYFYYDINNPRVTKSYFNFSHHFSFFMLGGIFDYIVNPNLLHHPSSPLVRLYNQ